MEKFAWFNGQKVAFEEGQTILEVAKKADIFIPTLCAFMPLNHTSSMTPVPSVNSAVSLFL